MNTMLEKIAKVIGVVILVLLLVALVVAWPTQLLWNWLMPSIFGLKTLSFWEAWGILMLAGFLFRSHTTSKK